MRLSNHRRCQLAGHVDRDAAGSLAIPRSFGAARRRRCQFGLLARELSLWRGAGALWRAVCLPCPQSCSHRRDRAVQARLRAWGRLPRCSVCRITGHPARTLGDLALTHGGQAGLGASFRYSLLRGHRGTLSRHRHPFTKPGDVNRGSSWRLTSVASGSSGAHAPWSSKTARPYRSARTGCRCTECRFAEEC